jgi:aspartate/methionine/tyrosine aminotransferase
VGDAACRCLRRPGIEHIRKEVAAFIEKRDGFPADPASIFLTDGASPAVQSLIRAITRNASDTILIPIPQYPLYSASIALYGGTAAGYYLDEKTNWGLDVRACRRRRDTWLCRCTSSSLTIGLSVVLCRACLLACLLARVFLRANA